MVKHAWTVLCKKSLIDKDTNNLSIDEILERLHVNIKEGTPENRSTIKIPIEHEIVSFLYRDVKGKEEEVFLRVDFRDPKGERLNKVDAGIKLKPEHLRMRARSKFRGLALRESGIYTFLVSMKQGGGKYKEVARIPLEVVIDKEQNLGISKQIN